MEPTAPKTVPQSPISGMVDPEIDLASIADPWEQRVTAISVVAGIRAAQKPPLDLKVALPPDVRIAPFKRQPPSLDDFRRTHLPDGELLAPHQVDGWIVEQGGRDGAASVWFADVWVQPEEIEHIDPDGVVLIPGTKLRFDPPPDTSGAQVMGRRKLEYATPLSARQEYVVRAGGVLDTLRQLSLFYRSLPWQWPSAQATTFVLTGLVPYAAQFARDLAIQHGRRPRPMSLKHLTLGVFTERHRDSGEGPAQRIARWNELHPEWAYTNADLFSSDSARAIRRIGYYQPPVPSAARSVG